MSDGTDGHEAAETRADHATGEALSPAEAARRLGVARTRVYALVAAGLLDAVAGHTGGLRVSATSVERRLARAAVAPAATGAPLAPHAAWAVLALASDDPAWRTHVAGLLGSLDRSRAKARLTAQGLLALVPRLERRAEVRRFHASRERLGDLAADARLVLTGASAIHASQRDTPVVAAPPLATLDAYVAESALVAVLRAYDLTPAADGAVVLRAVPEPWPFLPHTRVAPQLAVALDLLDSGAASLAAAGRAYLEGRTRALQDGVVWRERPQRRWQRHLPVPTQLGRTRPSKGGPVSQEPWDERVVQDARGLVALLFAAAHPQRRQDLAASLRVGPARLARAVASLREHPLPGLVLEEDGEHLALVTAPDCAAVVERHLGLAAPEPLSPAALHVLAVIAYEQPITRAEISRLRGVESDAAVETLLRQGLVAQDQRFGGRGRPAFLVTTSAFLRRLGIAWLAELPRRPHR